MKYDEVFKEKLLQLPKVVPSHLSFRQHLYNLFNDYLKLIKTINPIKVKIVGLKNQTNFNNTFDIQKTFINGLKRSLEFYYNGKPAQAFFEFEKTLNERLEKYPQMLVENEISAPESFYRIRRNDSNYLFKTTEMFHISYENRHKVAAQRFSINGYPTLYLSNAIYLA